MRYIIIENSYSEILEPNAPGLLEMVASIVNHDTGYTNSEFYKAVEEFVQMRKVDNSDVGVFLRNGGSVIIKSTTEEDRKACEATFADVFSCAWVADKGMRQYLAALTAPNLPDKTQKLYVHGTAKELAYGEPILALS